MRGISRLAEELLASQAGLCCMEWSEVRTLLTGRATLGYLNCTHRSSCHQPWQRSGKCTPLPCRRWTQFRRPTCPVRPDGLPRSVATVKALCWSAPPYLANAGNFTFLLAAISAFWKSSCLEKLFYNTKHHVTLSRMIYDMVWYDMIWYMILYDTIRYDMICDIIRYDMIWYMIWYDTIRYDTKRYDTKRYDTIRYDTIWYDMIWYDMIWYDMIWYDMIWYDMIWYDMIWYDMIWYCSDHGHIASSPCAHYFDPRIVVIVLRHAVLAHVCCSVTPFQGCLAVIFCMCYWHKNARLSFYLL